MWPVLGGICFVVFAVLAFVVGRGIWRARQGIARAKEKLEREGRPVLCWVVMANDALYTPHQSSGHSYAQVVFTFTERLPDREAKLQELANQLREFEPAEEATGDERIIGSVMKSHIPYTSRPLRIPGRVAGGLEAYTASVDVYWSRLPGRRLSLPYIYCRVALGEDGSAEMIEYPPQSL
jgi:hypothetical protein